ncbi:hypothetical protein CUC08_Gglean003506 [Alternaria sp. MG1]|nr:hypothetical protein CUC08_Gglean003506 [Alternaria sp. MG1]
MEADWTGEGTCYSREIFVPVALTNTALNIFTDVCFATLPIPIIWRLQMSRSTRLNLIGVLSLGYIAVALGIVKASYQVKVDPDKMFTKHLNVFGFLQLNVGIIAASIPTLKPLTKKRASETRRRQYDDIEQHVETIGSGRKYKPQLSFWAKSAATDKTIEMGKRQSLREKFSVSTTDQKDTVYSQTGDRAGSQERILELDNEDSKRIRCTTEVIVERSEHDGNK